jgi:predicted amidohydrolase
MSEVRISLLHLALQAGLVAENFSLLERGIRLAGAQGADLAIAPELCISGYQFIEVIGTDWIMAHPDRWSMRLSSLAKALKLAILFGHAERDRLDNLYNSAFFVNADGITIARHRKINTHAESWAVAGDGAGVADWNGLKIGILICADAYTNAAAGDLYSQGADLFLSPAAWAPGLHGPDGEWEQRTIETGIPMIVSNRTGEENTMNFCGAQSLVIKRGERLLSHSSARSAVLSFVWNTEQESPTSREFEVAYL